MANPRAQGAHVERTRLHLRSFIDTAKGDQKKALAFMARLLPSETAERIDGILSRVGGCRPSIPPKAPHSMPPGGDRRVLVGLRGLIDRTSDPKHQAALRYMAREIGVEKLRQLEVVISAAELNPPNAEPGNNQGVRPLRSKSA